MISLRSGLCILAHTGVSLQKVVPLGIHTNVNTYAAVSYWSCFAFSCRRFWRFFIICFLSPSFVVRYLHLRFVCLSSFILSLGPLTTPYVSCSGYGLVPVLSVSCSISFRACSIQISFFRFVVVPWTAGGDEDCAKAIVDQLFYRQAFMEAFAWLFFFCGATI